VCFLFLLLFFFTIKLSGYGNSVVKSRLQAGALKYKSSLDGLLTILREEGVEGLYKGIGSKIVQSVLTAAILFASQRRMFEITKKVHSKFLLVISDMWIFIRLSMDYRIFISTKISKKCMVLVGHRCTVRDKSIHFFFWLDCYFNKSRTTQPNKFKFCILSHVTNKSKFVSLHNLFLFPQY
jgi:Mitochondrial carrier protein